MIDGASQFSANFLLVQYRISCKDVFSNENKNTDTIRNMSQIFHQLVEDVWRIYASVI